MPDQVIDHINGISKGEKFNAKEATGQYNHDEDEEEEQDEAKKEDDVQDPPIIEIDQPSLTSLVK